MGDEEAMANERMLIALLVMIEEHDTEYEIRYGLVLEAIGYAYEIGYAAGFRIDPTEPEWPVAYIELPTGQVSWHLPQHPVAWDGHDTAEKYRRCREYAEGL